MPPDSDSWIERGLHAYRLSRYLAAVHRRAHLKPSAYDARIYVMLEPATRDAPRFVEGVGTRNGDIGLVSAQIGATVLDLTLLAVGHEFLHCLGASDKYDSSGHPRDPDGLAEPDKQPKYPQQYAEIMVGEVGTSLGAGKLPDTLDDMRIGPMTAREIGWSVSTEAPPTGHGAEASR